MEETESRFFAKKSGWKYPMKRTDLILLDLVDISVASNWDKKKGKFTPSERPFKIAGEETIGKKVISLQKARRIFKASFGRKSEEEILKNNKKFLKKGGINGKK